MKPRPGHKLPSETSCTPAGTCGAGAERRGDEAEGRRCPTYNQVSFQKWVMCMSHIWGHSARGEHNTDLPLPTVLPPWPSAPSAAPETNAWSPSPACPSSKPSLRRPVGQPPRPHMTSYRSGHTAGCASAGFLGEGVQLTTELPPPQPMSPTRRWPPAGWQGS